MFSSQHILHSTRHLLFQALAGDPLHPGLSSLDVLSLALLTLEDQSSWVVLGLSPAAVASVGAPSVGEAALSAAYAGLLSLPCSSRCLLAC